MALTFLLIMQALWILLFVRLVSCRLRSQARIQGRILFHGSNCINNKDANGLYLRSSPFDVFSKNPHQTNVKAQ